MGVGQTDTLTGWFAVGPLDIIPLSMSIEGEQLRGEISALDLLSRSGLVDIDPIDVTKPKIRFFPSWVHEYLATRSSDTN